MKIKFQKYYLFVTMMVFMSCANDLDNREISVENDCMNCNDVFLDQMYNHFYTEDRTMPFTGKCKGYDANGHVILEKNFVDGKQEGEHLEYYEDGTLKTEWHFRKGRQHGDIKGYLPDGSLQYHSIYYKGDLDSTVYP